MIRKVIISGMSMGKSATARHLYWVFSSNVAFIIVTFFTTILIARNVSRADNGIFLALFTFASLFSELGEVGLGSTLTSIVPRLLLHKQNIEAGTYVATAFRISVVVGIGLSLLTIFFSRVLADRLFAGTLPLYVLLTGGIIFGLIIFGFSNWTLSAYQRFQEMATLNVFYGLIRLGFLTLIVIFSKLALVWVLVIYLVSTLLTWLYSVVIFKLPIFTEPGGKEQVRNLVTFSGYLAFQKLFVAVSSRLDLLMLVPLAGSIEAGVYGIASRFALVYPLVIGSLGQVLAPRFAEFGKGIEAIAFFKKVAVVVILLLLSQALFYVFAQPLIVFLLPQYQDAVPVFKQLLIAMVGFVAATPFTTFIIYTLKKPQVTAAASFIQLIIIFSANSVLLPRWGRFGPVIGIGLGNLAVFLISVAATWYYLKVTDTPT